MLLDIICKEVCGSGSAYRIEQVRSKSGTDHKPPWLVLEKKLQVLSDRNGGFALHVLFSEKEADDKEQEAA